MGYGYQGYVIEWNQKRRSSEEDLTFCGECARVKWNHESRWYGTRSKQNSEDGFGNHQWFFLHRFLLVSGKIQKHTIQLGG